MSKETKSQIKKLRQKASQKSGNGKHRTPVAYGYTRVSHADSLEKGDSLPAQSQRIKVYYETHLRDQGIEFAGVENDGTNISAFTVPFEMRPAGKNLVKKLQPGDHLILDKADRLWRSIEDFCNVMKHFRERNITIHIINFLDGKSLQNTSFMGKLTIQLLVLVAEMESAIKSQRTKEGLSYCRSVNGFIGNFAPPGTTKYTYKKDGMTRRALRWNPTEIAIMEEIVRLRDEEKLPWHKCHKRIEEYAAKVEGRKVRPIEMQKMDRKKRWPKMYKFMTAYRYLKIEDPNSIPHNDIIYEAARQHRRIRAEKRHKEEGRKYAGSNFKSSIEEISREDLMSLAR